MGGAAQSSALRHKSWVGSPSFQPTPRHGMGTRKIPPHPPPKALRAQAELRARQPRWRGRGRHLHGAELRAAGPRPAERSESAQLQPVGQVGRAQRPHPGGAGPTGAGWGWGPGRDFPKGLTGPERRTRRCFSHFAVFERFMRGFPSGLWERKAPAGAPRGWEASGGRILQGSARGVHGETRPRQWASGASARPLKAAPIPLTE